MKPSGIKSASINLNFSRIVSDQRTRAINTCGCVYGLLVDIRLKQFRSTILILKKNKVYHKVYFTSQLHLLVTRTFELHAFHLGMFICQQTSAYT